MAEGFCLVSDFVVPTNRVGIQAGRDPTPTPSVVGKCILLFSHSIILTPLGGGFIDPFVNIGIYLTSSVNNP